METAKLGEVAMALMEDLSDDEESHGDENLQMGVVMILVEVKGTNEDGPFTYIGWRCSDTRSWIQRGLLHQALHADRQTGHPLRGDDDGA